VLVADEAVFAARCVMSAPGLTPKVIGHTCSRHAIWSPVAGVGVPGVIQLICEGSHRRRRTRGRFPASVTAQAVGGLTACVGIGRVPNLTTKQTQPQTTPPADSVI